MHHLSAYDKCVADYGECLKEREVSQRAIGARNDSQFVSRGHRSNASDVNFISAEDVYCETALYLAIHICI